MGRTAFVGRTLRAHPHTRTFAPGARDRTMSPPGVRCPARPPFRERKGALCIPGVRRSWLRPEILPHDPGLAARPPVRYTLRMARSEYLLAVVFGPSAAERQIPPESVAAARGDALPPPTGHTRVLYSRTGLVGGVGGTGVPRQDVRDPSPRSPAPARVIARAPGRPDGPPRGRSPKRRNRRAGGTRRPLRPGARRRLRRRAIQVSGARHPGRPWGRAVGRRCPGLWDPPTMRPGHRNGHAHGDGGHGGLRGEETTARKAAVEAIGWSGRREPRRDHRRGGHGNGQGVLVFLDLIIYSRLLSVRR